MQLPSPTTNAGHDFYRAAVHVLQAAAVPFLVGGAYAMRAHTDVRRDTKDFDVFLRPQDIERAMEAFRAAGYPVEMTFSHWLAKVHEEPYFIDLIFRSGNGICEVDDEWFKFAREADVLGLTLPVCPPEEIIWQKAYIMERERFDGADVQHLLLCCGRDMDWERLLRRFGDDWPVLFSHLVLFSYVYPAEQAVVPQWVMDRMISQLTLDHAPEATRLCRGPLLSRLQYLTDVERRGYIDVRTSPHVKMTEEEVRQWTDAGKAQEHASHPGPLLSTAS